MGEYINLMAAIAANRIVDTPSVVCGRYDNCLVPLAGGQSRVNFKATASTVVGQYVYVTGDTPALGNWDTGLAVPVDPRAYPVWANTVNLPASTSVQYKYFRRNADGSVTWENIAGGGNRNLTTPASGGTLGVNDTVSW